jgi:predicted nucleic acid-binding OB-fold protein
MIDNINQQCRQIIFIEMAARDTDEIDHLLDDIGDIPPIFDTLLRRRPEDQQYQAYLSNLAQLVVGVFSLLNLNPDAQMVAQKITRLGLYYKLLDANRIDIMVVVRKIVELSAEIAAINRVRPNKQIELLGLILEVGTKDLIDLISIRERERHKKQK